MRGALLLDIDGTLADTDPLHVKAFNAMLAAFGRSIDHAQYIRRVMGLANAEIMRDFFPELPVAEHRRLAAQKEATFRGLVVDELRPTPGLLAMMDAMEARGVPMAAVTNAPAENAELMLTGLGVRRRLRTIVIGDELPRGKPDPLPYLVAAERLGVAPGDCVAFEDSRSGMLSASRAGAFAIGVLSSLTEADLMAAGARFCVRDFTDARLAPLIAERLFAPA
jgi:HAD superfamily hydrolase (TIGR01509 family)